MVTEHEFHTLRARIDAKDPTLTEKSFTSKLPSLLEVLGHPSPDLRDSIGWSTLSAYFRSELCPALVREEVLDLLQSDKFLFFGIEKGEGVETLKRSFSCLTIADVLIGDLTQGPQLDSNKINLLSQELHRYMNLESDWRGQDPVLGWIHALAHAGDAFWVLGAHPSLSQEERLNCLNTLLSHIEKRGSSIFRWQEDFRIARAVAMLFENLPEEVSKNVLEKKYSRSDLFLSPSLQNTLGTFRCVYLELLWGSSNKVHLMESLKSLIN